jgi:hypothetical protein
MAGESERGRRAPGSHRSPGGKERTGLPARVRKPRRTFRIEVRLSGVEHQELMARAGEAKMRASAYVRQCALGRPPRPIPAITAEMVRELSRVGNNLSQLVRHLNMREGDDPAVGQIVAAVTDVLAALQASGTSLLEGRP